MAMPMGWWPQQLLGAAAVAAWLLLLAGLAVQVRQRWNGQREWSRKLVHIGTGAVVLIAWGCGIDRLVAIPAAATITLLAALNHRLRILPAVEDVGRPSYGTVAYGASITALLALAWPNQPAVVAAGVGGVRPAEFVQAPPRHRFEALDRLDNCCSGLAGRSRHTVFKFAFQVYQRARPRCAAGNQHGAAGQSSYERCGCDEHRDTISHDQLLL